MSADKENEKSADSREAKAAAAKAESFDSEPASSKETSEFRETSEGGYGWGV